MKKIIILSLASLLTPLAPLIGGCSDSLHGTSPVALVKTSAQRISNATKAAASQTKETLASAGTEIKEEAQDVGTQLAEALYVAPKDAIVQTIQAHDIDNDFMEVITSYPQFFVEQAQEIKEVASNVKNSALVAKITDATSQAIDATKNKVNQTGAAINNGLDKTKHAIKETTQKITQSDAADDVKNVLVAYPEFFVEAGKDLKNASKNFWMRVKTLTKALKDGGF